MSQLSNIHCYYTISLTMEARDKIIQNAECHSAEIRTQLLIQSLIYFRSTDWSAWLCQWKTPKSTHHPVVVRRPRLIPHNKRTTMHFSIEAMRNLSTRQTPMDRTRLVNRIRTPNFPGGRLHHRGGELTALNCGNHVFTGFVPGY